jgi:hypothetical protein
MIKTSLVFKNDMTISQQKTETTAGALANGGQLMQSP